MPKTPVFRREMYDIPQPYSSEYESKGVTNIDEQRVLFYATQFGGFRLRKLPPYISRKRDFLSKWFNSKESFGFISFTPSTSFLETFGHLELQPLLKRSYSNKSFSDGVLVECGVSASQARDIESFQEALNNYYSSVRVGLRFPASGIRAEERVDVARFNGIPNLHYSPRSGNRLFHCGPGTSFQRIPASLRPFLTIDGEETTEIDISAATIQFLNIVLERDFGLKLIDKGNLSSGDPYKPFLDRINGSQGRFDRESLKKVLYTLIYSDIKKQRTNVSRKLRLMGGPVSYEQLEYWFDDFFDALEVVKTAPPTRESTNNGQTSADFGEIRVHPPHLLIFREESRFARSVLEECCLRQGFVVLPIHDSFLTQRRNHDRLERVISDVSFKDYGYVLGHKTKF